MLYLCGLERSRLIQTLCRGFWGRDWTKKMYTARLVHVMCGAPWMMHAFLKLSYIILQGSWRTFRTFASLFWKDWALTGSKEHFRVSFALPKCNGVSSTATQQYQYQSPHQKINGSMRVLSHRVHPQLEGHIQSDKLTAVVLDGS